MLKMLSLILIGLFVLIALGCSFVFIYKFVYEKFGKTAKKLTDSIKGKIFFNTILRTTIQQYIDIAISTMIAFKTFCSDPNPSLNTFVTFLTLIYLVAYPFCTSYIVKSKSNKLKEEKVK